MKRFAIWSAVVLAPPLLSWILGGFVAWDWNPSHWEMGGRSAVIAMASVAWAIAGSIATAR